MGTWRQQTMADPEGRRPILPLKRAQPQVKEDLICWEEEGGSQKEVPKSDCALAPKAPPTYPLYQSSPRSLGLGVLSFPGMQSGQALVEQMTFRTQCPS